MKPAPWLLALVGAISSCGEPAAPAAPSTERASGGEDASEWMRSHFVAGRSIKNHLVRGELDEARSELTAMSREPGPAGAPEAWEPRLAALRSAAHDAATAGSLPEVTRAFGGVASACASCHEASGAELPFESLPADGEAAAPMVRHQWAAERMWQGLVGASPERFREGALVLAEAPLHPAELVVGTAPPAEVMALSERVRTIAAEASEASTRDERAAIYGELLSTCASCHGQLERREVSRAELRSPSR